MFWANLIMAAGTFLLAWPIFWLNRSKRLQYQLNQKRQNEPIDADARKMAKISEKKLRDQIAEWRSWHQLCLFGGYGLIALSTIIRLFTAE